MKISKASCGVVIACIALVSIVTFPLPFCATTHIPGFYSSDEPYAALWNFWWLKHAFQENISPESCDLVAAPFGLGNCKSGYPFWNFINAWLSILTSNVAAYSVEVLFSFFASWLTMYYLMRYVSGSSLAAFFSACVFAFCPYHFSRSWQHLGLAQIQWMPLYILSLLKLRERASLRNLGMGVVAIFLVFSFELHYAYFMFIATAVFVFYSLAYFRRFDKAEARFWGFTLVTLVAGVLFALPALSGLDLKQLFFAKKSLQPAVWGIVRPFENLFAQSARPLSYLLPSHAHPFFGRLTEVFLGNFIYGESMTEHTLYLGWIPLVLACIALKRRRGIRESAWGPPKNFYIGFFAVLGITAWLFSQPPWWQVGPVKLYMPSFFMYKVLPMFRAYCRFGIVVMLAVAVLAGFGLLFFLERFRTRGAKAAAALLLCAGVLFEFWNYPPYKVIDVSRVPAAYSWLAAQPGDLTIAEYPLDLEGPNEVYKFYQTKHMKKIINGTIPHTPAHAFSETIVRLSEAHTAAALKRMGVRYVLVHKEAYLKTELSADSEELQNIPRNPGLKLIGSFVAEECPREGVLCLQKTGEIEVYEVVVKMNTALLNQLTN